MQQGCGVWHLASIALGRNLRVLAPSGLPDCAFGLPYDITSPFAQFAAREIAREGRALALEFGREQYGHEQLVLAARLAAHDDRGAGGGRGADDHDHYLSMGLLKTATMPNPSALKYDYESARRLTDVVDAVGNKVHPVSDNIGCRASEQVSDTWGNPARWSRETRNWRPIHAVALNPERDVVAAAPRAANTQRLAA
jgi:hypothetical protein